MDKTIGDVVVKFQNKTKVGKTIFVLAQCCLFLSVFTSWYTFLAGMMTIKSMPILLLICGCFFGMGLLLWKILDKKLKEVGKNNGD